MTGRSTTGAIRGHRIPMLFALVAVTIVVAVAGCGSSSPQKVSAGSYVRSVCTTATSWYRTLLGAGGRLQANVHRSKSLTDAKRAYVDFVDSLLHATQRAEQQLKNAGTPSVKDGKRTANDVIGAFSSATRGLKTAAAEIRRAPTHSSMEFQTAAAAAQGSVQRALQSMSSLAPRKNPELRAAALKDPTCQRLRALG